MLGVADSVGTAVGRCLVRMQAPGIAAIWRVAGMSTHVVDMNRNSNVRDTEVGGMSHNAVSEETVEEHEDLM